MKIKLIFKGDEVNVEAKYALNGLNYLLAIHDLDEWIRSEAKYNGKYKFSDEEIRGKIREFLEDNNVSLEDLV